MPTLKNCGHMAHRWFAHLYYFLTRFKINNLISIYRMFLINSKLIIYQTKKIRYLGRLICDLLVKLGHKDICK